MNLIDFSQLGGFPFTQDTLGYMQSSTVQMLKAWFADVPIGQPVILSGMQFGAGGPGVQMSPGYFYVDGEVYAVPYTTAGAAMIGQNYVLNVVETPASVTFQNTATHGVYVTKTAALGIITGTSTVGKQYLVSSLVPAAVYIGARARTPYANIAASATSVSGSISYCKDYMANTLHVFGSLTHSAAQGIQLNNWYASLGITLPVGFRPPVNVPLTGYIRYSNLGIQHSTSTTVLQQIGMELNTAGNLLAGWIRPDVATTAYSIYFNQLIPL